ncbi:hypothetical protein KR018_011722, partial [Drosophila ironensis]
LFKFIYLSFGLFLAVSANNYIDRGFDEANSEMRRGTDDTCRFLKGASDHVYHLMVNNYEELKTHLIHIINESPQHIFLDMAETSGGNSLATLNKLLDSLDKNKVYMKRLESAQQNFLFWNSQLRDAERGLKRDIIWGLAVMEDDREFLKDNHIEHLGSSKCIHLDTLPDTSSYVEAMEKIVKDEVVKISENGILKLENVSDLVKKEMDKITPQLTLQIRKAKDIFMGKATEVRNIFDAVIGDIHLTSLRTTKTYDDVYERFGPDRRIISYIVFIFIIIVSIEAIENYFQQQSHLAMILIFCILSLVVLLGLFYLVIGVITYVGACAQEEIIGNNYGEFSKLHRSEDDIPMQRTDRVEACAANENIFTMLKNNKLYDIDDFLSTEILDSDELLEQITATDFTDFELLTDSEKQKIEELQKSNLSGFSRTQYLWNTCADNGQNLMNLGYNIEKFIGSGTTYWDNYFRTYLKKWKKKSNLPLMRRLAKDCYAYSFIYNEWKVYQKKLVKAARSAEKAYLDNGLSFNDTVKDLLESIVSSEMFLRSKGSDFISSLALNLTKELNEMIYSYLQYVVKNADENVGSCYPLKYVYYRGVAHVCERLVDPINALWLGLLLCALFMLIILFVAHRLMCLYLKIY